MLIKRTSVYFDMQKHERKIMNFVDNKKSKSNHKLLFSSIAAFLTALLIVIIVLLLMRPTIYLSKESGFPKNEAIKYENGRVKFIVPETIDTTKTTFIEIKQNWFTTNRLGKVVSINVKPGKKLAVDFLDLKQSEPVFEITVKNLFGVKTTYDVLIDYSNYLRVFFPKNSLSETSRPTILPYFELDRKYRHIKEELYRAESFFKLNENGQPETHSVGKDIVFSKDEAKGSAFLVDNTKRIAIFYDFVLTNIFKNSKQKSFLVEYIPQTQKTIKTLDPKTKGIEIMFMTPPLFILLSF